MQVKKKNAKSQKFTGEGEAYKTSKMDIYAKTAKDNQSLFVFGKNSIPEVWTGSQYVSQNSGQKFLIYKLKQKRAKKVKN